MTITFVAYSCHAVTYRTSSYGYGLFQSRYSPVTIAVTSRSNSITIPLKSQNNPQSRSNLIKIALQSRYNLVTVPLQSRYNVFTISSQYHVNRTNTANIILFKKHFDLKLQLRYLKKNYFLVKFSFLCGAILFLCKTHF